jgi:hypothetical protein
LEVLQLPEKDRGMHDLGAQSIRSERESTPKLANWRAPASSMDGVPIAFELRFEPGYEQARDWLHGAAARDEFDHLCQTAREGKNEAA